MSKQLLGSLTLAALMASVTAAQVTTPPAQPQGSTGVTGTPQAGQSGQAPGQAGQAGQLDQGIATCLYLANQEELAIAQFGEGRVQNDEVKKFIGMIMKDHREALQKLEGVAPQLASMNLNLQGAGGQGAAAGRTGATGSQPGATGTPGNAAPAQTGAAGGQQATAGVRAGGPAGQPSGDMHAAMAALQRRTAEECLSLTQKELGEHNGAEFDHAFIGQQMGAHIATLAKLRASREFASAQLQPVIDEATQMVEHHLEEAKQIAHTMKGQHQDGADGEQARREGAQPRRQ